MKRWVTIIIAVAIVGAVAVGLILWREAPPSPATQAALRAAVVRFELAKASVRPPGLIGKALTRSDRESLQRGFEQRIAAAAAGRELARWRSWDYAKALLEDEGPSRLLVGCSGRVVYWDFRSRSRDGGVVVRAGVEQMYKVVRWLPHAKTVVPQRDWKAGVVVDQYALKKIAGDWKVTDSTWWRFYDPATHTLQTGP